jgi:predicted amidohydrolase
MRSPRVVSVALEVPRDADFTDSRARVRNNLDNICEALDVAGRWDPDFVCFPELMLHRWTPREKRSELGASVPGTATDRVGELAERLDTCVWLPLHEGTPDADYNAVALISPDGDVRGTYRKLRPTVGEMERGIDPGDGVKTWETEFGRVGAIICFDLKYPEIGIELARQGVDMVFFPSHLHGRKRLRFWASEYGYHVIKSHPSSAEFVTPGGDIVARNEEVWLDQEPLKELDAGGEARYAYTDLNPNWEVFGRTPANRQAVEAIQATDYDIIYHDSGHDEIFALESRSSERSVADLVDEYGMETYREWLDRVGRTAINASEEAHIDMEEYPESSRM